MSNRAERRAAMRQSSNITCQANTETATEQRTFAATAGGTSVETETENTTAI